MNGYKLTQKLKKIRGETYLSSTAQALYHELVSICNERKWEDTFFVKNDVLCSNLNMTVKTLIKARDSLSDSGLISFLSLRDKRCGCQYSFIKELSAGNIPDDKVGTCGNIPVVELIGSTGNIPVEKGISSGIIPPDNTFENIGSSGASTGNIPDETQITPYIDIINIKQESIHTQAHETPPAPKKKKSRKKEVDNTPLEYPFNSLEFMSTWEFLRNTPKWKGKLNYALQLSLNKLGKYPEEFAIYQMNRAIESNWTGVVFPGTDRDFEEWRNKNGKSNNQVQTGGNNPFRESSANKAASRDAYERLADAILEQS